MNDRVVIFHKEIYLILLIMSFAFVSFVVPAEEIGFGFTDDPALYAETQPVVLFHSEGMGEMALPTPGESSDLISRFADEAIGNRIHIGLGRIGNSWGFGLAGTLETLSPISVSRSPAMADIQLNADFIFGYGRTFTLGSTAISIGGEIIPKMNLRALDVHLPNLSAAALGAEVLPSVLKQVDQLNLGLGLESNLGFVVGYGMFRGLLTLRDIGHTRFLTYSTTLDELRNGHLGLRVYEADNQVPMTVGMGIGLCTPGDVLLLDIRAEYDQPLAGAELVANSRYARWTDRIQIDVESTFSENLVLQMGFHQGTFGGGFGVIMDNVAMNADFRGDGGAITVAIPY